MRSVRALNRATLARQGLLERQRGSVAEVVGRLAGLQVDLPELPTPPEDAQAPPRFLSRWDSVLIGHDVRERILPARYTAAVVKPNGDFLPTFLVDGFVAGLWSIESTKGEAVLRLEAFEKLSRADGRRLEEEGERLVRYHEPEAARHEVTWAR
jgi:hypothetical protein